MLFIAYKNRDDLVDYDYVNTKSPPEVVTLRVWASGTTAMLLRLNVSRTRNFFLSITGAYHSLDWESFLLHCPYLLQPPFSPLQSVFTCIFAYHEELLWNLSP